MKPEIAVNEVVEEIEVTHRGVSKAVKNFMIAYGYGKRVRNDQLKDFAEFAQVVFERYPKSVKIKKEIRGLFKAIDDLGD